MLCANSSGVEVHPCGIKQPFQLTAHVVCCSCDLPARAIVQNFTQFNGVHGCNFCEQPGVSLRTERGGNVRVFPYDQHLPKGPSRTQLLNTQYAKRAVEQHSVVRFALWRLNCA